MEHKVLHFLKQKGNIKIVSVLLAVKNLAVVIFFCKSDSSPKHFISPIYYSPLSGSGDIFFISGTFLEFHR